MKMNDNLYHLLASEDETPATPSEDVQDDLDEVEDEDEDEDEDEESSDDEE